ncbi:phosphoribosylformylglycinamidine cyclo-ligase [Helicobacter kayseriensis]|uniref:phosphoribosylformylglycinamidine cyclo-ligase n=1 Tax=Helicobacter kayseriensis TaxID=2905877 RepID=UPI001E3AF88F|nr:phosphoribosylformylglycinamidine cyclo-ligase [Helicobacter kayseriensis]MCE3047125.1 phosphoribosylformylglycinamidine cyclo-ligase [Helicobacter kayseriensis]MCE3048496.1 phosphoribosylformylglycinamidine cyclo-ligase [Helicobacter kayseriensis]
MSNPYKDAGVDVEAGYQSVSLIKEHIAKTQIHNSLNQIGDFGGLFPLQLDGIKEPILVSGTDGVGTKLKFAFMLDQHSSIGIDCVAMCVNDILCCGAKPLFFLDYIALDKNYPNKVSEIVQGIAQGCIQAQCQLLGGETAEMPGFYAKDEYDVAGFCVGIVDKSKMPNKQTIQKGDRLIGIASSGVHSNGFSLVRKILQDRQIDPLNYAFEEHTLAKTLLTPTKIYVQSMLQVLKEIPIKSIAHITGGGFFENIPRSLPQGLGAKIQTNAFPILPIFEFLAQQGGLEIQAMFGIFNMGIGMTLVVRQEDVKQTLEILHSCGEKAYEIGEIIEEEGIHLC